MDVKGTLPDELLGPAPQPRKANRISGEVTFSDHHGREIRLRPTFEAALEIEDVLGGLDALRLRVAAGGTPGIPAPTTRELGVIIAAGVRATGEERVDSTKAARFAFDVGRDKLRKPLSEFLRALVDGGKLREDDLKNAESSNGSTSETEANELFEEMATRSGVISESPL
jgi:hypothetical protein